MFYVTSLLGAGVLVVPGLAARVAGPASLVAWGALAVASVPIAVLFAEMSTRDPDCAGLGALVRRGLGDRAGDAASLLLLAGYGC